MSECSLCGFPVGSDACNASHFKVCAEPGCTTAPMPGGTTCAKHAGRRLPPVDEKRNDFLRGWYCAVACLINMHGCGTEARELFRNGGKKEDALKNADEPDLETFRKHGLLP